MADTCKLIQQNTPLLDSISTRSDMEKLAPEELSTLADEIRQEITRVVCRPSDEPVGPSSGPVELLVGLHYALSASAVKIIVAGEHQDFIEDIPPGEKHEIDILEQADQFFALPKTSEDNHNTHDDDKPPISAPTSIIIEVTCDQGLQEKDDAVVTAGAIAAKTGD